MKRKLTMMLVVVLLLPAVFNIGCKSQTALTTVYKSEGALITTVDSAMQAWAQYVKGNNGVTQTQVDTVKAAYTKYYNAQQIAKVGLHLSFQTTNAPVVNMGDVQNAENALIQLVTSFINKK